VTIATPENEVSTWSRNTEEQYRIQERILRAGIALETGVGIARIDADSVVVESVYTGEQRVLQAATVVMVTSRAPNDDLYHELVGEIDVERVGDCLAPGTIATAVYSGHKYARELDATTPEPVSFLRER
jgi:dimethylamine/trimethylamine dehydrogenase